jgi:hypothetical protein
VINDDKLSADILIPLANPKSSGSLTGIANQLAGKNQRTISLMTLVRSSRSTDKTQEARDTISAARQGLSSHFTIHETVRFDSNPARGIYREAREEKIQTIIMGWHSPDEKNKNKGRILDPVLRKAPCNVIIAKDYWYDPSSYPRQILVPLSGIKSNDELALKTAESMIDPHRGGRITILYFNKSPIKLNHINFLMTEVINSSNIKLEGIASDSDKPAKTTILQSRDFDLVVLGINEPWLFKRGKPSFTEKVAQELTCAMLMVRTPQLVRSRINFFT